MGDTEYWTIVSNRRRKPARSESPDPQKIAEPCWFFNNGGCKHKDGTSKTADDCKYLHTVSKDALRPPHLVTRKPCDKYNLEGECKWHDTCKYSHRNLTPEEWSKYYPDIPYTLKTNVQKRVELEGKIHDLAGRVGIAEYKQEGLCRDIQHLAVTLQTLLKELQPFVAQYSE